MFADGSIEMFTRIPTDQMEIVQLYGVVVSAGYIASYPSYFEYAIMNGAIDYTQYYFNGVDGRTSDQPVETPMI